MSDVFPMEQVCSFQQSEVAPAFLHMARLGRIRISVFPLIHNRRRFFSFSVFKIADPGEQIIGAVLFEDPGVTEIFFINFRRQHFRSQDRVPFIFLKMIAIVIRHGKTLSLHHMLRCRVHQPEPSVFFNRGTGTASVIDLIRLVRVKGYRSLFPVNKVRCCDMKPVHRSPLWRMRIMLIE